MKFMENLINFLSSGHLYLGKDELNSHPLIVEDCTVVYARSKNAYWGGGRLFNMRALGGGSGGDTITFRDKSVSGLCFKHPVKN